MLALAGSAVVVLIALLMGTPVTVAGGVARCLPPRARRAAIADYALSLRAWRQSSPAMTRRLPAAFAIAARRPVLLAITTEARMALRAARPR